MDRGQQADENKRDWRISVILAAIWFAAIAWIMSRETEIPVSMLVIASAFFVFLIPAMNDLVRSIEKATKKTGKTEKEEP